MIKNQRNSGVSLIESLVCMVIIGIGFIGMIQLSAFTINSMDRATEKNKLNYLSEMVLEDMIGDPDNVTSYGGFIKTCCYSNTSGSKLHDKKKNKWRNKLQEKGFKKQLNSSGYVDLEVCVSSRKPYSSFIGNNKKNHSFDILKR